MPKFAVYFIPQADEAFYQLGTQILGYDVRTRQAVALPSELEKILNSDWTRICRTYGFHLTICEALDCQWAAIPQVEQELANLLGCFDASQPFVFQRKKEHPVGIWGEERRNSIVLLYEPNASLGMLHTLLVARLTPLGTGSDFLKDYMTNPERELPAYMRQQIRLFFSPTVFENWHPHFTLLNPYIGEEEATVIAARFAQRFQAYEQIIVATICLVIQENNKTNWQIYREFRR